MGPNSETNVTNLVVFKFNLDIPRVRPRKCENRYRDDTLIIEAMEGKHHNRRVCRTVFFKDR